MQRFSLSPNVTMAATVHDDDDDFGTFLAYSPTTASLARSFGHVPPNLRLPSPSPSLSPLAVTPPHLRNIASAGVGLASNPPQPPPRRVAPYKGTPPTEPLLSSSPLLSPYSSPRFSDGSPPSVSAAGVGLFSPSPSPSPLQQLGITPRRATPSPQSIGTAGVGLSSPAFSSSSAPSSTPRRRPTVRRQRRRRRTPGITRGSTTSSARSRVARIRNAPTTHRRVQSLQLLADDAVRGRNRDRNPNGDHHLQGEQASSHSHSRLHASNVTVKNIYTRDTHRHAHLQKGCHRGWIETRIFCVYCLR